MHKASEPGSFRKASSRSPAATSPRSSTPRSSSARSTPPCRRLLGKLMMRAEAEGRMTGVPYMIRPRWCGPPWDLGIRDSTAIWFAQVVGREIRIIRLLRGVRRRSRHYVREINASLMSMPGTSSRMMRRPGSFGTGKSRLEVPGESGHEKSRARAGAPDRGLASMRCACFCPKCWLDAKKCARGIDALEALPRRL